MVEQVNIKDFNAIGDGETDDTLAISDAINFAKENEILNLYIPAGTYIVTRGFNLDDNFFVFGDGIDNSIIKLKPGLPPLVDNRYQSAIFMGRPTYGNGDENDVVGQKNSSTTLYNVTIKNLSIVLNRDEDNFDVNYKYPVLGAIQFYNPENCIIENIKISFTWWWGISLKSTKDGAGCKNNIIQNCIIENQDWYISKTPDLIPRSNPALIGIELTSYVSSESNGRRFNLLRDESNYTPSKTSNNKILNNIITNGSHGISLYNAKENTLQGNQISGCSNRGIICSACSDNNLIDSNHISNIGSAGILIGYNGIQNVISNNLVENTLGVEGIGIKLGFQGNFNVIEDNIINGFYKIGIGALHGAIGNIIKNNKIDGVSPNGKVGIKITSNDYNNYYIDNLKFDQLDAKENSVIENYIQNVDTPIFVGDEVFPENNSKIESQNTIQNNFITPVQRISDTKDELPKENGTGAETNNTNYTNDTNDTKLNEIDKPNKYLNKYVIGFGALISLVVIYLLVKKNKS